MAIDKVIDKITSSNTYAKAGEAINGFASKVGSKFEKSPLADVFSKYIEPVGANNRFATLAGLMVFAIIIPRVRTALNRNPDNKEATSDEIKEILFRDVQSVGVVLFMLKILNSLIAAGITRKKGLPMTNKPYQKLFDESAKTIGEKVSDFMQHPIEKLKIIGKNILDTIHPTEGVRAKVNNEYTVEYSNYEWKDLPKLFTRIQKEQGDKSKVFDKIIESTIAHYENILNGNSKKGIAGLIDKLRASINKDGKPIELLNKEKANLEATIAGLKELQKAGVEGIDKVQDESVKQAIVNFLKNPDNLLVEAGKGANAWLRLAALALEASYLGFGIPALNQLRLEKKYLREHKDDKPSFINANKNENSLINKNIKAHEVKLYHNFIR